MDCFSSVVWSPVSRGWAEAGTLSVVSLTCRQKGWRERAPTTGGVLRWAPVRPTQLSRLMAGSGGGGRGQMGVTPKGKANPEASRSRVCLPPRGEERVGMLRAITTPRARPRSAHGTPDVP